MSERPDEVGEEEFKQLKLLFEEGDDTLSLKDFAPLWRTVYPTLSEAKAKKTASTLSARFVYDYTCTFHRSIKVVEAIVKGLQDIIHMVDALPSHFRRVIHRQSQKEMRERFSLVNDCQ